MADPQPSRSNDQQPPPHDRTKERRSQASDLQPKELTFASSTISEERLAALKEFLKHASADEIAAIRKCYGENKDVLKLIADWIGTVKG